MSPSDPQRPQDPASLVCTACGGKGWILMGSTLSAAAFKCPACAPSPLSAPATTAPETETARAPADVPFWVPEHPRTPLYRARAPQPTGKLSEGRDLLTASVHDALWFPTQAECERWIAANPSPAFVAREHLIVSPRASSPSAPSDDPCRDGHDWRDGRLLPTSTDTCQDYDEEWCGRCGARLSEVESYSDEPAPAPRDEGDEALVDALVTKARAGARATKAADDFHYENEYRALLARLAELRRNWDAASSEATKLVHERESLTKRLGSVTAEYHDQLARAEAAEAKLAEVEAERDEFRRARDYDEEMFGNIRALTDAHGAAHVLFIDDAVGASLTAAERRGDEAREALREVDRRAGLPINPSVTGMPATVEDVRGAIAECARLVAAHVAEPARAVLAPTATTKEDHHG